MKKITICIPTYEMNGLGHVFLKHSFDVLTRQTFKDFDVVISDNSKNEEIKNLCNEYSKILNIHYFKNSESFGNSANTNNAIMHATGSLIKILFQDDFLYSEESLKEIADNFDLTNDHWLVTASEHTKDGKTFYRPFYPKYHPKIHLGENTIGSPSVLTIINKNPFLFDTNLKWLMDCEYYKRCYDAYGEPKILNTVNVVNTLGKHQVSNTQISEILKIKEHRYVANKYNESSISTLGYGIKEYIKKYLKLIFKKNA